MVIESFCFSVFICPGQNPAVSTLWNFAHISHKITNVTNVRGERCACPPPWRSGQELSEGRAWAPSTLVFVSSPRHSGSYRDPRLPPSWFQGLGTPLYGTTLHSFPSALGSKFPSLRRTFYDLTLVTAAHLCMHQHYPWSRASALLLASFKLWLLPQGLLQALPLYLMVLRPCQELLLHTLQASL